VQLGQDFQMKPTPPRIGVSALTALCVALPLTAAEPDIAVKSLGSGQYELTLRTSAAPDIFMAQRTLLPAAKAACGTEPVEFENYAFDFHTSVADANPTSRPLLRLTQTIRCGASAVTAIPQIANAPDGWKPSADDQATVESQTYRYLYAKGAGDFTTAYAMFSDAMKAATHQDAWQKGAEAFNASAGQVLSRRVLKITWYKDPPSAPAPGIYAAADYTGEFINIPIYCGYVAWYRGPDGTYTVIHEEQNSIDKDSMAKMNAADVKALAAKFGCSGR
jgi:hypothetical protein